MGKAIYVISGASGSGKTTLSQPLTKNGIKRVITYTTRDPRPGEINNIHYRFVSKEEFDNIEMIEWSNLNGKYYGTSKCEVDDLLDKNDKIFAVLDENGVVAFKEKYPSLVKVIYVYCNEDILLDRLSNRKCTEEERQTRIRQLKKYKQNELKLLDLADYILVNNHHSLNETIKMLMYILQGD